MRSQRSGPSSFGSFFLFINKDKTHPAEAIPSARCVFINVFYYTLVDETATKEYVDAIDAAQKSFVESNLPKVGTSVADGEKLKAIYYMTEDEIPENPEVGVEYAIAGFVEYSDLDANL